MTAAMAGPQDVVSFARPVGERVAAPAPTNRGEDVELRAMLVELRDAVAAQRRMLDTLDTRREQLDELIADAMPIANATALLAMRAAGVLERRLQPLANVPAELRAVRDAPAPGLLALLRRLRDPYVRRAVAMTLEGLRVVGRLAEASAPAAEPPLHDGPDDDLHQAAR
jgi:uncharacterized protein YjgD (DUF1641 family)